MIRREQVHRRHELVVGFVLLSYGLSREPLMKSILAPLKEVSSRRGIDGYAFHQRFPECGLVLLVFESHLVINLLDFLLSNKKSRRLFCRTLIRRPSSKHRLYCLYTKKRADFLPARLIGWVLNFLEIGEKKLSKCFALGFTVKNTLKMPDGIYGQPASFFDP